VTNNFTFNEKFGLHGKNNPWGHLRIIKGNTKKSSFTENNFDVRKTSEQSCN